MGPSRGPSGFALGGDSSSPLLTAPSTSEAGWSNAGFKGALKRKEDGGAAGGEGGIRAGLVGLEIGLALGKALCVLQ